MAFLKQPRVLRCDDPQTELWRHAQWVFSPAWMRRALQEVHKESLGHQLLEDKAADCACCVQQAREYFAASASASAATSPVLCYYGMLSLAAALVIVADRNMTLRSMPRKHGLECRTSEAWSGVLEAECTPTPSGVFRALAEKDLVEWCLLSLREESPRFGIHVPPSDRFIPLTHNVSWLAARETPTLRLAEVLSRLPDLALESHIHPQMPSPLAASLTCDHVLDSQEATLRLEVSSDDPQAVERVMRLMSSQYPNWHATGPKTGKVAYELQLADLSNVPPFEAPPLRTARSGDSYFVLGSDKGWPDMPEICDWLVGGYLTSNLARYFPRLWMGSDRTAPETALLTERFVTMARRRFPHLVLNALAPEPILFRP